MSMCIYIYICIYTPNLSSQLKPQALPQESCDERTNVSDGVLLG